ncbi:MAG: hypothetical protein ABSE58_12845, partial [Candidatus Limnocylindrales bacterium]
SGAPLLSRLGGSQRQFLSSEGHLIRPQRTLPHPRLGGSGLMSGYEAGTLPAGAPAPLAKPFSALDLADAVGALFGRTD